MVGSFLQNDMNDPATLRKRIAELETENKSLKEGPASQGSLPARGGSGMIGKAPSGGQDWMNFGSGPLERPTTAS